MIVSKRLFIALCCVYLSCSNVGISTAVALDNKHNNDIFFDITKRKLQLQLPAYAEIKTSCIAKNVKQPNKHIPRPVKALKATDGYGTDRGLNNFAWFTMIHGGRALAGEQYSVNILKRALLGWARSEALTQTEVVYDAYYALKRGLLPIIVNYAIIRDTFSVSERTEIDDWLDGLVKESGKKFNRIVDENNHRYLADSVLTVWGKLIGNQDLYDKGAERFTEALSQMDEDGSLALETRRGSRALWYMRQSLANLSVIAQVYQQNGDDLYNISVDGKNFSTMLNYYISAVNNPLIVLAKSAQNLIPGPSADYMQQDLGMLKRRGKRRNYMAFAEAYIISDMSDDFSAKRLTHLMNKTGFKNRPLIDDFVGGNATCFWAIP